MLAKIHNVEIKELPEGLYISPDALLVLLECFEGPLDLLLFLIRKQNLDILEVSLAQVTNQYLEYINNMQAINLDLAAEYLFMASVLIAIKSRLLLPKPSSTLDEDEQQDDPRHELVQRLIEYEQIKNAAKEIMLIPIANHDFFWLEVEHSTTLVKPLPTVTIEMLNNYWEKILLRKAQTPTEYKIARQAVSLQLQMDNILNLVIQNKTLHFESIFTEVTSLTHLIVNFLAILELAKMGQISLYQKDNTTYIGVVDAQI